MDQDGVIAAVKDDLQCFLNAFDGNFDTFVLVSGNGDLKVFDAIFLEELDIVLGIVVANKSTNHISARPVFVTGASNQQDSLEAKCLKMLKVACPRKAAAIYA